MALAQINRGVESQANKRPLMSDIKDSGDIEQDMDLGLLLYRDDYYNSDTSDLGVMEIIVSKNRNGSTGTCEVKFDPSIGRFSWLRKYKITILFDYFVEYSRLNLCLYSTTRRRINIRI